MKHPHRHPHCRPHCRCDDNRKGSSKNDSGGDSEGDSEDDSEGNGRGVMATVLRLPTSRHFVHAFMELENIKKHTLPESTVSRKRYNNSFSHSSKSIYVFETD